MPYIRGHRRMALWQIKPGLNSQGVVAYEDFFFEYHADLERKTLNLIY